MNINILQKSEFLDMVYNHTQEFLAKITASEVFVVKQFYPAADILAIRNQAFAWGQREPASWHPLKDGCPDYHRLHDNYPQAWVQQKFHAFYYHGYYEQNAALFTFFREIFEIKNFLAGYAPGNFIGNIPSDGIITRVNVHHYPVSDGYQAEHIDPVGSHAHIQTLIQGSAFGSDWREGGVYARKNVDSTEKFYLDPHTDIGDLLVLSPGIPHGVAPVNPNENYNPDTNDGRWMLLPIFVMSDYPRPDNIKPVQVAQQPA